MKSSVSLVEAFIVRLSLATMLAVLLALLFLGPHSALRVYAYGCPNYNDTYFGTRAGGNNYFHVHSYYYCYYGSGSNSYNETNFFATGTVSYIAAQGDTWLTQLPRSGGTRYGETGRSPVKGYPTTGEEYVVQETPNGIPTLSPEWGCMWYNLPDYLISVDYNCADMV